MQAAGSKYSDHGLLHGTLGPPDGHLYNYGLSTSIQTHAIWATSIPGGGQGPQTTAKEPVMQPSCRPRGLHQLGLQSVIRHDALDQRVAERVTFSMSGSGPVKVEEGNLIFRVGHRLCIDEK